MLRGSNVMLRRAAAAGSKERHLAARLLTKVRRTEESLDQKVRAAAALEKKEEEYASMLRLKQELSKARSADNAELLKHVNEQKSVVKQAETAQNAVAKNKKQLIHRASSTVAEVKSATKKLRANAARRKEILVQVKAVAKRIRNLQKAQERAERKLGSLKSTFNRLQEEAKVGTLALPVKKEQRDSAIKVLTSLKKTLKKSSSKLRSERFKLKKIKNNGSRRAKGARVDKQALKLRRVLSQRRSAVKKILAILRPLNHFVKILSEHKEAVRLVGPLSGYRVFANECKKKGQQTIAARWSLLSAAKKQTYEDRALANRTALIVLFKAERKPRAPQPAAAEKAAEKAPAAPAAAAEKAPAAPAAAAEEAAPAAATEKPVESSPVAEHAAPVQPPPATPATPVA